MGQKLLGNKPDGLLFVISAPAGTGKSTLVEMIVKEFPNEVEETCSCTTRLRRPGEVAQRHYEFISIEEFEKRIQEGAFLEYAKVFGQYYGTPRAEIEKIQKQGKHAILVIDTQGALQLMKKTEGVFIFISPPSFPELRRRLFKRSTEDEEKIQERLQWAEQEVNLAPHYDYHIVNDELNVSYQVLRSILIAEEHYYRRTKDAH